MVLLDDARRHVEVNGAYLSLLGYPRGRLIGRPVYELLAGGPLASAREWRTLLRRRQFTGAADLVCADGRQVRVEFAGHPEIVTGQQLVLFVAIRITPGGRRRVEGTNTPSACGGLTRRELEVIRLLSSGLTGPEIAEDLQLAHHTVRTHVRNAMAKAGARSRAQLVAVALAEGLYVRESS